MLANLKDKLLHANLFNASEEATTVINDEINLQAGAAVLQHFQEEWEELHKNNEVNARNAEIVGENIEKISKEINTNKEHVKLLTDMISNSNLVENISNCLKAVKTLYETAQSVETGLTELEQLIDEVEYQKLKSYHQFHLSEYAKKKETDFGKLKISLQEQYSKKVEDFEISKQKVSKKRQKDFQDAFKSDIEIYKNTGTIPKKELVNKNNSAILEEIDLDYDPNELDQFFNE